MTLDEFKTSTQAQRDAYGDSLPLGSTYDGNGNILTHKDSDGCWRERSYDSNRNELTFKDSAGFWDESTYDSNDKELTYKNSEGLWRERTYDSAGKVLTLKDGRYTEGWAQGDNHGN